jgi:hypothetical protein
MPSQDGRKRLGGKPDIIIFRQFRENQVRAQQGQETLLMNMTGFKYV